MFSSLRFRLPAVFLAGVVLAGAIASAIAITLFQDYTRKQTLGELKREAVGLAALYGREAGDIPISTKQLERATGDRLFYVGLEIFPGAEENDLTRLPDSAVPSGVLDSDGTVTFEFVPPGADRTYLAVTHPLRVEGARFAALVVASPKAELREEWVTLAERLGLALLAGVVVSGLLGWYFGLRITRPVLRLSSAADEIARGNYDIHVSEERGRDEIAHLSRRFDEMALRLRESEEIERNFLMTVSHELRTPLTAIGGHVAALREGVVEDPDLRAASLDVVAEETRRLSRLVGDIIDLAKLDMHRFTVTEEEVDMEQLVERAYAGFADEARRRAIEFEREVRGGAVIETDGDRVLQIITNLLSNAFRWTPDGGRVDLELEAANGTVAVAVEDTGPGISAAERERIFRPFYSGGSGGTGLGLAIASELADALGGSISVRSEEGRGSRFELVLPARQARQLSRV
jgi:signal transduction histidine kinase